MRFRKHGETLGQKITSHLHKVKSKNIISHIGDSFFRPAEEHGSLYMLRRTNLQRDDGGRTLNIVDEIEVEAAQLRAEREEEEAKDMTFAQFMASFQSHIEGTATNDREAHESAGDAEDVKASQQLNS